MLHKVQRSLQHLHLEHYAQPEGVSAMPLPPVPSGPHAPAPTLSQSTTASASASGSHLLAPLNLSAASFAVPHLSYQSQSLHSLPDHDPPLPSAPASLPASQSQTDLDPAVISTTPATVLLDDPPSESAVPGLSASAAVPTPAPTPGPSPPEFQQPPQPNPTPTLAVPYPLAIHIAILSTLCPTLARPASRPATATATFSPDLTITPPPPPTPPQPTPPTSLDLIPSVLASLTRLSLPTTRAAAAVSVVDTCSATWDLATLVRDPDVGVLASCVDLASLCVLEPVKSQQQQVDHEQEEVGAGWHVVPEAVGEYWAYLMKSVEDDGLMAQLKQYFGEYLARRDKLASAQAKHQQLMAALGPETTEQHAKAALKDHIHNLHVYNEYQDLAQSIMGQLADMDGVTVKHVYEELGIDLDEGRKRSSRSA